MNQKTLNLMEEAISTAGKWTELEIGNDSIQLEFDNVQLYKPTLDSREIHSSQIAIRLADNVSFSIFYNNITNNSTNNTTNTNINNNGNNESNNAINDNDNCNINANNSNNINKNENILSEILSNSEFSYKLNKNEFKFQDFDFLKEIANYYSYEESLIGKSIFDVVEGESDFIFCFTIDEGFENSEKIAIVGIANQLHFFNEFESLNQDLIKKLSNDWWIYWIEYWKLKGTKNEYYCDPACEAIPF
ncbi:MAG: hypothetical protein LBM26_03615 [Methanobrevibacter sp.]|jgi:hypothetical protein|nr:hypothetical protein [Methanobrevibacter sp.]